MVFKRGDIHNLSDATLRRLWLTNVRNLDSPHRRMGWRDKIHRRGQELEAEMESRWKRRQRQLARAGKEGDV